jgi:hypothetical protein
MFWLPCTDLLENLLSVIAWNSLVSGSITSSAASGATEMGFGNSKKEK